MPAIKTIFFDLGNTLCYLADEWVNVLTLSSHVLARQVSAQGYSIDPHRFLESFGRHVLNDQNNRDPGWIEEPAEIILIRELAASGFFNVPQKHVREALDCMFTTSQQFWPVEEDAQATLEELAASGFRLGLISNAKDRKDVHQILENAGIRSYFEKVIISADVGFRKPHPQIFKAAMESMQVAASACLMVGDQIEADINGAKNVGMKTIWIKRRVKIPDNLPANHHQPDKSVNELKEIPKLLNDWLSVEIKKCPSGPGR